MAKKTNINELARRYTTAAFELAAANKELDKVSADLATITTNLLSDAKTAKFLNSPLLTAEKQVDFIKGIAQNLKVSPTTLNFLLVVARNRRLGNLKQIIAAFQAKIAEENGEIPAQITSAEELDAAQINHITAEFSKKTGKKVIASTTIDKSIIGGLIVKIGSAMYDYSVRTRLNRLADKLKKAS